MFCLWIKNNKICNLKQLKEFFDFDIVEMYLLGGSLIPWLKQCGSNDLAQRVKAIDLNADISSQLSEIFGVKLPQSSKIATAEQGTAPAAENNSSSFNKEQGLSSFETDTAITDSFFGIRCAQLVKSSFENQTPESSFISESLSSFRLSESSSQTGSFELNLTESSFGGAGVGSFETGVTGSFSMQFSSFEQGSFALENTINSSSSGSFILSSFNIGSFGEHEFEYEYQQGGSFTNLQGSFNIGSFNTNSFNTGSFEIGSFKIGSFNLKAGFDKVSVAPQPVITEELEKPADELKPIDKIFLPKKESDLPPEEKIKQNILSCPLNRFGYGINLI